MICDILDSRTTAWVQDRYPSLRMAFDWLRAMPEHPADLIEELDGPQMYVNVHGYETKASAQCRWESHRHTVDLQYCISGGEAIDWTPFGLEPLGDYAEAKDAEHWRDAGSPSTRLIMRPRSFVLFLPNELHRPKISDGVNPGIRKLVFKIHASRLGL